MTLKGQRSSVTSVVKWRKLAISKGSLRSLTLDSGAEPTETSLRVVLRLRAEKDVITIENALGVVFAIAFGPPAGHHISQYRVPRVEEWMMKFLKKHTDEQGQGGPGRTLGKSKMMEANPGLAEYMTTESWDDGSARAVSTLSLSLADDGWKASLNDKEGKCSAFATGSTPELAISALNVMVESGEVDWRKWKEGWKNKPKKKPGN